MHKERTRIFWLARRSSFQWLGIQKFTSYITLFNSVCKKHLSWPEVYWLRLKLRTEIMHAFRFYICAIIKYICATSYVSMLEEPRRITLHHFFWISCFILLFLFIVMTRCPFGKMSSAMHTSGWANQGSQSNHTFENRIVEKANWWACLKYIQKSA